MNINFEKPSILTDEAILRLEEKIKTLIPNDLKSFLKSNCNAAPKINGTFCCFSFFHEDGWIQDAFIERICSPNDIITEFEDRDTLNLYVRHFDIKNTFVEVKYLFPFAFAANGTIYYSISGLHTGKIYFADTGDFGIQFVKNSLQEFWDSVY